MKFQITAEKNFSDKKTFYYDNELNIISDEFDKILGPSDQLKSYFDDIPVNLEETIPFSKDFPLKKSKSIDLLKIQLGLGCNYSCEYCSQKFVERPTETSKKDIDDFMSKLDVLEFSEQKGLKIEFWGGEPLVYWKTLKPLAERLSEKFKQWETKPMFSIITNGSLLTEEICSWLIEFDFSVAISHDGPNQSVRGPDPFLDPKRKKIILDFYKIMKPKNKISFNAMLNGKNISRKAVYEWFFELTGDKSVILGEGEMVDAYDDDGINNSLTSLEDHFKFRQKSFVDIYMSDGYIGFTGINDKINQFTTSVISQKLESKFLGQKCGMDNPGSIAVDLKGNVITCQNVSALETSKNGESHLGGNLSDYGNVEFKSVTHWKSRDSKIKCSECPVLHLCKGSCMFLDGNYWDVSCENAYSNNIALFALAFAKLTNGYIPTLIKSDTLPLHRQDIWGTIFDHQERQKKKIIPIKVINKKEMVINDVEVYSKSISIQEV